MVGLLLLAPSLGLSNFAASVAIGIAGVDASLRVRVAVVFGLFEAAMPVVGLVLGHGVARALGSKSDEVGGALLILTGTYSLFLARRKAGGPAAPAARETVRLLLPAFALSIDNLVVGFALGTRHVSIVVAAVTIAVVSVCMSLVGLELGRRLGAVVQRRSESIAGAVLVGVGAAVAAGLLK